MPDSNARMSHSDVIDTMTDICLEVSRSEAQEALIEIRDDRPLTELAIRLNSILGEFRLNGSKRDMIDAVLMYVDIEHQATDSPNKP